MLCLFFVLLGSLKNECPTAPKLSTAGTDSDEDDVPTPVVWGLSRREMRESLDRDKNDLRERNDDEDEDEKEGEEQRNSYDDRGLVVRCWIGEEFIYLFSGVQLHNKVVCCLTKKA